MSETTNETTQETTVPDVEQDAAQGDTAEHPQTHAPSAEYLFPHEVPSDHWNADFGDGKQVYEGAALPVWILAGWAIFILWAMVYLIFGLPTAF